MASFITTQKGPKKLIFDGYAYLKHKDGANGKVYWRCDLAKSAQKCNGVAILVNNEITVTKQHNHASSPTRIEVQTIKSNIRTSASTQPTTAPRAIVNTALEGGSQSAKIQLPELQNLQKTAGRIRKSSATFPTEIPKSFAEVNVPLELSRTRTALQEVFIMHDTGKEDPQRIIALASRTDIVRLRSCSVWMADGTFKAAPSLWYQIWVVHGLFKGLVLPFVYFLLPSKTEEVYCRAVSMLIDKINHYFPNWVKPSLIWVDYEMAEIKAFHSFFAGATIHGCYFHFMQAVWRHIQDAGLSIPYKEHADFRELLKCLSALAFCSPGDVRERFIGLAGNIMEDFEHNEGVQDFSDYFERTWVGRGFASRPRFPIEMWNCHKITLDKLPRTTNSAEPWHNTLNRVFTSMHPDPYKLISALFTENV